MKLDYYTLLCPEPIPLSVGTIKQPTLRDIGILTFEKFNIFELYLTIKPREYCQITDNMRIREFWKIIDEDQQNELTMYDIALLDEYARMAYQDIFNFFFVEDVVFNKGVFLVLYKNDGIESLSDESNIRGIISPTNFFEIINIIKQVCCIDIDEIFEEKKPKFKNAKAKKLYDKMLKATQAQKEKQMKKDAINLTLPNIISATANKCFGLNIINIWDATLFQLYDQFNKAYLNDTHYINSVHIAVWGDEKNEFDSSLWYTNTFNQKSKRLT